MSKMADFYIEVEEALKTEKDEKKAASKVLDDMMDRPMTEEQAAACILAVETAIRLIKNCEMEGEYFEF